MAVHASEPEEGALDEVIVTTTRQPRRIADEPSRIEVIDSVELAEKVAASPTDVSMLLNETSGLRVQMTSPGLGAANVRIEGLRGRYSQVLADGLPLYGGQAGGTGLLQIPPLDLAQVEVLKGVASALYGASALGGVINFVSRRPDGNQELLVNQTSRQGTDFGLWWSGAPSKEGWSYSLLASANRQVVQDVNGDGWADIPGFKRVSVRPRLYWNGDNGRELFVTAGVMLEDRMGGTVLGGVLPPGDPLGTAFVERLETHRSDLGLTARWPMGDQRTMTLRGSFTHRDAWQTIGNDSEPTVSDTSLGEVALNAGANEQHWVIGLAIQQDRYRNPAFPDFDYSYTVPGVFAQDDVEISDSVTLSAGGRVDHHERYGSFFSPRLAALWRPGGAGSPWRARLSVGGGYFAPTPTTEETEATGLSRVVPTRSLLAETAKGLSLDVNRLWRVGGGSIETNVTVFQSEVTRAVDLIAVSNSPDQFAFRNEPQPTRTVGTEELFRWRTGPVTFSIAHAYVNSTEVPADTRIRVAVPLNPRHTGTVGLTWDLPAIGHVAFEGFYTGHQALTGADADNPYLTTSPAYVIVGLSIQRQVGAFSIFLNGENLTDRRLTRVQPLVLPVRAADGRWTVDAWAPLDGRTLNVGLRWKFGGDTRDGTD